MMMQVSNRIAIHAGEPPGTLVAVLTLWDSAGNQLSQGDPVTLVDGMTLEVGPVGIEVESPVKFGSSSPTADKATTPAKPTPAAPAKPPTPPGRR